MWHICSVATVQKQLVPGEDLQICEMHRISRTNFERKEVLVV